MYGIFTFIWRKCRVNVGKLSVCAWQFLSFESKKTACIWAALLLSSWQMASHVDQGEINVKTMTRIRKHFGKSSRTIMGEIQQLTLFALAQKVPTYKWVRNSQWFFGSSSSQRGLPLYPKRVSPRVEANRMDQDLFSFPGLHRKACFVLDDGLLRKIVGNLQELLGIPSQVRWVDSKITNFRFLPISVESMGLLYLPTCMVNFYGNLVGKYTNRPMDPMELESYRNSSLFVNALFCWSFLFCICKKKGQSRLLNSWPSSFAHAK